MKRLIMKLVFIFGGLGAVLWLIGFLLIRWGSANREIASEERVTPELLASMKRAGFPITIERAFTASSHGGWHGDGMDASIYKFSTNEVPALVDSLRRNFTNFVWTECQAHTASIGDLRKLVPPEMMPALGTRLLNGRLADGNPTREYLVDTSQGILYDITHTF